jgi:hypothetical protein
VTDTRILDIARDTIEMREQIEALLAQGRPHSAQHVSDEYHGEIDRLRARLAAL